jgi:hypothetical protein
LAVTDLNVKKKNQEFGLIGKNRSKKVFGILDQRIDLITEKIKNLDLLEKKNRSCFPKRDKGTP